MNNDMTATASGNNHVVGVRLTRSEALINERVSRQQVKDTAGSVKPSHWTPDVRTTSHFLVRFLNVIALCGVLDNLDRPFFPYMRVACMCIVPDDQVRVCPTSITPSSSFSPPLLLLLHASFSPFLLPSTPPLLLISEVKIPSIMAT